MAMATMALDISSTPVHRNQSSAARLRADGGVVVVVGLGVVVRENAHLFNCTV